MGSYFEIVQGIRLPARLSGHSALDFCNTYAGWDGQSTVEYLQSFDHLAVWAGFVGLLPPRRVEALRMQARREPARASAAVEQARGFRADLYRLLRSDPEGWQPVSRQVDAAATASVLRKQEGGFRWALDDSAGLETPLLAAAWSAADLLTSPDLGRVRACPGPGCGWLFLDRSGRRRWCTMATCGNRAKARRFAARRREQPRGAR